MALSGKTVYIAGGCGTVGKGLTRSFLQNGARLTKVLGGHCSSQCFEMFYLSPAHAYQKCPALLRDRVAVSSRTQERLDELKNIIDSKYHPRLILIKEDASTETGTCKVLEQLKKQGGVEHVISTIGSWKMGGPLTKQSVEDFDREIHDRAKSHFICAKTFLPYLSNIDGSTYTFFSGTLSEGCDMADISLLIVGGSCLYGVADAARAEFKHSKVAVSEVRIGLFIVPELDKNLDERTFKTEGLQSFDKIGNDVMGDFTVDVIKSRARGIIRFGSRKEMDEVRRKLEVKA